MCDTSGTLTRVVTQIPESVKFTLLFVIVFMEVAIFNEKNLKFFRSLQPNCSYGDHHHHNTPMHYAAKHGMKHLIRAFLNDLGGNPNM